MKVRGYRIELGEIESALLGCDGIADAVVMAPTATHGEAQLVAYYVAADSTDTDGDGTDTESADTESARYREKSSRRSRY
ncbi:hypothetical protein P4S72_11930 [Vibrio sp. PP-XX7]